MEVYIAELSSPLVVRVGDRIKMTMKVVSTYDTEVTRDFAALYGKFEEGSEPEVYFGQVVSDMHVVPGENTIAIYADAEVPGTWDAAAIVGEYDPSTGSFDIESVLVKRNVLKVEGIMIKDFTLSKA